MHVCVCVYVRASVHVHLGSQQQQIEGVGHGSLLPFVVCCENTSFLGPLSEPTPSYRHFLLALSPHFPPHFSLSLRTPFTPSHSLGMKPFSKIITSLDYSVGDVKTLLLPSIWTQSVRNQTLTSKRLSLPKTSFFQTLLM